MTMKRGGFIVNGRPYQFFSKRAFVNRLLNLGTTRRGFWNSFQSSNKGGRRMGAAKRKGGVWWNFSDKDFRENLRRARRKKVDKVVITTSGAYPNDVRRGNIMEELMGGGGAHRHCIVVAP